MFLDILKFVGKALINEIVRQKSEGLFSSYDELKEWNELTSQLSKEDNDDFSIFDL